jgi:hypothetical protein
MQECTTIFSFQAFPILDLVPLLTCYVTQGCEALVFLCPLRCTICFSHCWFCRWGKFHDLLLFPPPFLSSIVVVHGHWLFFFSSNFFPLPFSTNVFHHHLFSFSQYSSLLFLSSTIVLLASTFHVSFLTLLRFFFSSSTPFLPQPPLFINIIFFHPLNIFHLFFLVTIPIL